MALLDRKAPIGIIGSACRFPGGCDSPSKLWQLLQDPQDVLSPFPSNRLKLSRFHHINGEHHGSTDVDNKSYLLAQDPRLFDASFFNLNPMEADGMDPQQRLLLETVYEALEAAGCPLEDIQGSLTAVYVGVMNGDYYDIQLRDLETLPTYTATGTARSILSNRVSYFFDLKGPSMTIDTACSSSLVALHQAVQTLRSGESSMAIVAGANLLLDPAMYVAESKLHMLSPEARSRMWDQSANGYARGEGFAAIVLKLLHQAEQDHDHIECIIRETAVNSDGRTKGITMPSATAQAALIRQAYANVGLDSVRDRCQYFECHGTGTQAGDPVEARAIRDAFFPVSDEEKSDWEDMDRGDESDILGRASYESDETLFVGSIKTVIGHLEGCAGLAGVLKASLALQHRIIPPNLHFHELNPEVAPFYSHLQIPTSAQPWPAVVPGTALRASVNSFGFGGTNAHAVLERYESDDSVSPPPVKSPQEAFVGPLIVSAHQETSLRAMIRAMADEIEQKPALSLSDLSWMLQCRRSDLAAKAFFSGATRERLLAFMRTYLENVESGSRTDEVHGGNAVLDEGVGLLGIFTGQGAQWVSMGRNLIESCWLFRESIERCEASLAELPGGDAPSWSLTQELVTDEAHSRLSDAALSQPLCTAVQIGLVDLLSAAGIHLDTVVGHSSGEIAAAYAAGLLSSRDVIRIAYYRGFHAQKAGGPQGQAGGMIAVGISFDWASEWCAQPSQVGRIAIAASNAMSSVTLSGDMDAIHEAKRYFDEEKIFTRILHVDMAYHSHHMQPCAQPYLDSLRACQIQVRSPCKSCVWVSSVRGNTDLVDGVTEDDLSTLTGPYWVDNLLKPVLFSEAVECALWRGGPFHLVVEVGPHPALKGPATQILKATLGSPLPYVGAMRRGDHEVEAFSGAIGYIWSHLGRSRVDFDGYRAAYDSDQEPAPRMLKGLPSYAWDHGRLHWRESRISRNLRLQDSRPPHELLGRRVPDDLPDQLRWRNILRPSEIPWIRGHEFQSQVIFPAAGYVSMAVEAGSMVAEDEQHELRLIEVLDLQISKAVILHEGGSGVEMVFTLRKLPKSNQDPDNLQEAEFACYICSDEVAGSLEQTCTGRLRVHGASCHDGKIGTAVNLPRWSIAPSNIAPVDLDRFYNVLAGLGLNYQGLFRALQSSYRTLGYATGTASWPDRTVSSKYTIHPAVLDVAFHTVFAAYASPASDGLWHTPYLPIAIHRLVIQPQPSGEMSVKELVIEMEAIITPSPSTTLEGDLQVSFPGHMFAAVQVEGLIMRAVEEPNIRNDHQLFSETVWDVDIGSGLARLDKGVDQPHAVELVDAIERTALYYFRTLLDRIKPEEIPGFQAHHRLMVAAVQFHLDVIRSGRHPAVLREWLKDSQKTLERFRAQFPDQIDMALISAIGKTLPAIVRGESQQLEIMMADGMLDRLYVEGCGFPWLNAHVGRAVRQITHRHPQAQILEIGAGTGGTTRKVLEEIGLTYGRYTYTDISSGFFDRSRELFSAHQHQMVFRVLDIEKDVEEQGFAAGTYDIVLAANVLHATRRLADTLQHVRQLLRPGGLLIMIEVTGHLLRMPALMGGLPGWWLGAEEGRQHGPGVSSIRWDELLVDAGFTGVDTALHDNADVIKHSCSMIVSQAVDDAVHLLRKPLSCLGAVASAKELLILGGNTLKVAKVVRELQQLLAPATSSIRICRSLEDIDFSMLDMTTAMTLISLTELDQPLFAEPMTGARWRTLQALFSCNIVDVLWITAGRYEASPLSNMFVGMGRALMEELPHLHRLQFLDVGKPSQLQAWPVAEAFVRLVFGPSTEDSGHQSSPLWTTEIEIKLDKEFNILIPRVVPSPTLNQRLNARRRIITTQTSGSVTLVPLQDTVWLQEAALSTASSAISLDIACSVALPGNHDPPWFLCLGQRMGHPQLALALSASNASRIGVHPAHLLTLETRADLDQPALVHAVASYLVALQLRSAVIASSGSVLVYEPSESLETAISQSTAWRDCKVIFVAGHQSSRALSSDWISIHPYATRRVIQQSLPHHVSCVIDASTSGSSNLSNYFPSNCVYLSVTDCIHIQPEMAQDYLTRAYQEVCTGPHWKLAPFVRSAQELHGASVAAVTFPAVIDWRSSSPWIVRIAPLDPSDLFSSEKTYLLVGMIGGLGLSLGRWMVQHGVRHLVLTSRRGEVDARWKEEMRHQGATIEAVAMDVADLSAVQSVYRRISESMPPVAGVCNAAMVLSDKLFADMDVQTLNDTLAPKVAGTQNLDTVFGDTPLDFFILFSSVASVVGNAGQSNYHAANLFMASLAANRRARGLAASVINIGMVVDVGYVARSGRWIEDHLRSQWYAPLTETDVYLLFAEAVHTGHPVRGKGPWDITMGISPFSGAVEADHQPAWTRNPRFNHFQPRHHGIVDHPALLGSNQSAGGPMVPILQRLGSATSVEAAQEMLRDAFGRKLEAMLQLTPNTVNVSVPLLDLGCDSLLAVEIRTWFLKEVQIDVPVLKILSGDTVLEICLYAAQQSLAAQAGSSEPTTSATSEATDSLSPPSSASSQEQSNVVSECPELLNVALSPARTERQLLSNKSPALLCQERMSYAQSRLWFLAEYLQDSRPYNITIAYQIHGPLDVDRLRKALSAVLDHHASLRTGFTGGADSQELIQSVWSASKATFSYVPVADSHDISCEFERFQAHTWNLADGETLGVTLLQRQPHWHVVIFGYHHIVIDGVSWALLLRDLQTAYEGRPLRALNAQPYTDFTVAQRQAIERGDLDDSIAFWQHQHDPLPVVMPLLPVARVRSRRPLKHYNCQTVTRKMDRDLLSRIRKTSQALQVTPFHFHLAAIQVLFARFLQIKDLCLGVTDANRTDDRFTGTTGFFLNLLPLRFHIDHHGSVAFLAQQTAKVALAAIQHAHVPFDLLLERLQVPRSLACSPLFQVVVNYRVGAMMEIPLGACRMVFDQVEDAKNPYDLGFGVTESSAGTALLQLSHQCSLYDSEAANLIMDTYMRLLRTMTEHPDRGLEECPLFDISTASPAVLLGTGPRIDYTWPETLTARFDTIAEARSNQIAIQDASGALTYAQLTADVNRVATLLMGLALPPASHIATLGEPSAILVACLLAILKTGHVSVSLDLSLPSTRHDAILGQCKPALLLYQEATKDLAESLRRNGLQTICMPSKSLSPQSEPLAVPGAIRPDQPAFLLFTSGSTGAPKGIVLSQAGFVNHLALKTHLLSISSQDVVLQQSSLGFDMSIVQTFCALANGGRLVIAPQTARGDPVALAQLMHQTGVTFTIATPSEYLLILRYGREDLQQLNTWRHACMGGEVVSRQLIQEFARLDKPTLRLTNCYGPTEITAAATFASIPVSASGDTVNAEGDYTNVGRVLPNYSVYVLDEQDQPVPVGMPGEICIGGAGVALNYWNQPDLTAAKFIPDMLASPEDQTKGWTRMYKTGDRGRLTADGSLVFLGRKDGDTQVKLRGLRIELDEVASALQHVAPGVIAEAIVSVRGSPEFLVAHVVLEEACRSTMRSETLQAFVHDLPLPRYMWPALVIAVDHWPTTPNGKIDRRVVEAWPLPSTPASSDFTNGSTADILTLEEGELRLLWENVLQQTTNRLHLGRDSDFFMVGGNSVLLVALQGAIKDVLGLSIAITDLYQASTLGSMAARIHATRDQAPPIREKIDWEVETAIPPALHTMPRIREDAVRSGKFEEVLLTGAETFLGSEILRCLIDDPQVRRVHCIAVPPHSQNSLPDSDKIILYAGMLHTPGLGLSRHESAQIRSCIDVVIHVGAVGHCLNTYASLRVPNVHATHTIAALALPRRAPVHFLSSNRVALLSGRTIISPSSLARYPPPADGSEGFTATKWASECFLEQLSRATGLAVCIHRPCAVTGDRAPNEDALNALLRYSRLLHAVPYLDNFDGYLDFCDVHAMASQIIRDILAGPGPEELVRFRHHSSGTVVPVREFRQRMEDLTGSVFEEVDMTEWISRARPLGIDSLITLYLDALVSRQERIAFPYLGGLDGL